MEAITTTTECTAFEDGESCHYYDNTDREGDVCERCQGVRDESDKYWRWYFGAQIGQQRMTVSDIEDVYSHPTDAHKREVMLREVEG